jgi:hypothetical protein
LGWKDTCAKIPNMGYFTESAFKGIMSDSFTHINPIISGYGLLFSGRPLFGET